MNIDHVKGSPFKVIHYTESNTFMSSVFLLFGMSVSKSWIQQWCTGIIQDLQGLKGRLLQEFLISSIPTTK